MLSTPGKVASASRTASGNSGALALSDAGQKVSFVLNVTAQSGTTPTLDVSVEWSNDKGTTFIAPSTAIAFTQVGAATGSELIGPFDVQGDHYRVVWTLGGGSPDYTFSVDEFVA